jgi:hypothetical protein
MRNTQYALMALGLGMTLWFASLAWIESGPSSLMAAPVPGPTPAPMTRISPQTGAEPVVAHRPVPGYPPRSGTSQTGSATTSSAARP